MLASHAPTVHEAFTGDRFTANVQNLVFIMRLQKLKVQTSSTSKETQGLHLTSQMPRHQLLELGLPLFDEAIRLS